MTQSKLKIAERLAELRGDGSNPEDLAKTMSVMKMHQEIENLLEAKAASEPVEPPPHSFASVFDFFQSDRE